MTSAPKSAKSFPANEIATPGPIFDHADLVQSLHWSPVRYGRRQRAAAGTGRRPDRASPYTERTPCTPGRVKSPAMPDRVASRGSRLSSG